MHSKLSPPVLGMDRLRRITEIGLVIIGAGAFLVSLFPRFALWQALGVGEPFERAVVGLISVLLLSVGLERMQILTPIKASVLLSPGTALAEKLDTIENTASQANRLREIGIYAFYANRGELPDFPSFIESASADLLICALSADVMIQAYGTFLEERLKKGCNIRFLLPDERLMANGKAIAHLAPQIEVQRTPDHLVDAMKYLILLKQAAEKENLKGKLKVKFLDFIPPMGFIMLDGHENHASIRVEQYVYKCDVVDRPSYEVVPTTDVQDLFSVLRTQFELCWNEAAEWKPGLDELQASP